MKIDLTRLPVAEMVVAFLVAVLAITFIGAFGAVDGGGEAPSESPTASAPPEGSPPPGGVIAVSLGDNFFDPSEITVAAGQTVTFEITNEGLAIHNMHISGPDGTYAETTCKKGGVDPCSDPNIVSGGQSATLVWDAPDTPAEFPFRCDFHPEQMKGTITVQ